MIAPDHRAPGGGDDEPPPFGRSWPVLYAIVLLNLILMIVLFYAFTKAYS